MQITLTLNGVRVSEEIAPDMLLIDFVRAHGCKSVKRGCETSNCGLCTVFMDDKPVLSCSVLAARADGHKITTLEGLQQEAAEFGAFIADQGAEQCGFCNPGFIMNALALFRELEPHSAQRTRTNGDAVISGLQPGSGAGQHRNIGLTVAHRLVIELHRCLFYDQPHQNIPVIGALGIFMQRQDTAFVQLYITVHG